MIDHDEFSPLFITFTFRVIYLLSNFPIYCTSEVQHFDISMRQLPLLLHLCLVTLYDISRVCDTSCGIMAFSFILE